MSYIVYYMKFPSSAILADPIFYEIDVDGEKGYSYPGRVSHQAFSRRDLREYPGGPEYHNICSSTLQIQLKIYNQSQEDIIQVNGIFEFYKLIGYDYKRKKFA